MVDRSRLEVADPDLDVPNVARIYDFFLGGAHHFAVDREQATKILVGNPDMEQVCRANRSYLGRVVAWCRRRGIDQFLDLGSGIPTVGNVHELAPEARVAYVDVDPVAAQHARELTADLPGVTVTAADLTLPDQVLGAPTIAGHLDLSRPVALLAVAVLHFVHDDVPAVLRRYRERLVPGSVLAISHGSADQDDAEIAASMRATQEGYRSSANPVMLRDRDEIRGMFTGFDLAAPGVVDVVDWPAPTGDRLTGAYGVVGILRGGSGD